MHCVTVLACCDSDFLISWIYVAFHQIYQIWFLRYMYRHTIIIVCIDMQLLCMIVYTQQKQYVNSSTSNGYLSISWVEKVEYEKCENFVFWFGVIEFEWWKRELVQFFHSAHQNHFILTIGRKTKHSHFARV